MDRALNPKDEKQMIYEIYRACRLCGAGAGYKMPIIQNVLPLNGDCVELRHKIMACLQIQVNHTDRMPPLICELCVDKVNEFYQFLDMCRQTNKRTRLRLGLPLVTKPQGSPESEQCILGVTEPVYPERAPAARVLRPTTNNIKREKPEPATKGVNIKIENGCPAQKSRAARLSSTSSVEEPCLRDSRPKNRTCPRREGAAKRTTRQHACLSPVQDVQSQEHRTQSSTVKRLGDKLMRDPIPPAKKLKFAPDPVKPSKPGPQSSKTSREKAPPAPAPVPPPPPPPKTHKKGRKRSPTPPKPSPLKSPATSKSKDYPDTTPHKKHSKKTKNTSPKTTSGKHTSSKHTSSKHTSGKHTSGKHTSGKTTLKITNSPEKAVVCQICNMKTRNPQGLASHLTTHVPSIISAKCACNACEVWFPSSEEAMAHHREHRLDNIPYKCTRCYGYFKLEKAYEDHFGEELCLSVYEVPDVSCAICWRTFPTSKLLEEHPCAGEDARPGGKCSKCSRNYTLLKNLLKHETTCNYRKKGEVVVPPEVAASLLPMRVRVARCDALLSRGAPLPLRYGLDRRCIYPYMPSLNTKSMKPTCKLNHMVEINEDIKEELCADTPHTHTHTHTHMWDAHSDNDSDNSQNTVDSLSNMSLKTILGNKSVDKITKKKVKTEETFDSLADFQMGKQIDSIICSLGNEDAMETTSSNDSNTILDKTNSNTNISDVLKFKKHDKKLDDIKDDSRTSCDSESILEKNVNMDVAVRVTETADETSNFARNETDVCKEQNDVLGENAFSDDLAIDDTRLDDEKSLNVDSKESKTMEEFKDSDIDNQKITPIDTSNCKESVKDTDWSKTVVNTNKLDINNDSTKESVQIMESNREQEMTIDGNKTGNPEISNGNNHSEMDVDEAKPTSHTNEEIDVIPKEESRSEANRDIDMRDEFGKRSPNNEDLSKIDEITNKILQEAKSQDNLDKDTVCVNGDNQANDTTDDEKLMAELDAQIANNDTSQKIDKKPFLIDDLLRKPEDLRSLHLDSISDDDFHFDV